MSITREQAIDLARRNRGFSEEDFDRAYDNMMRSLSMYSNLREEDLNNQTIANVVRNYNIPETSRQVISVTKPLKIERPTNIVDLPIRKLPGIEKRAEVISERNSIIPKKQETYKTKEKAKTKKVQSEQQITTPWLTSNRSGTMLINPDRFEVPPIAAPLSNQQPTKVFASPASDDTGYARKDNTRVDSVAKYEKVPSNNTVRKVFASPLPDDLGYVRKTNDIVNPLNIKGTVSYKENIDVGNMQDVINKFADAGINIKVTSGLRPNAITSSGKPSWHASGYAIDIVPGEGETWDTLRFKVKNSPALIQWLRDNGYGILDETSESMMRRTNATGPHWHIGKDKIALRGLSAFSMKNGGKFQIGGTIDYSPYQKQYNLSYNPFKSDYEYRNWYQKYAYQNGLSLDPNEEEHYYDYKGYYDSINNGVEAQGEHLPDTFKLPGHKTFSVESKYYQPGMMAGHWEGDNFINTPFSEEEMETRQHWAESRFKNGRVSQAGARGAYQLMPATWNEIISRNNMQNADINNYNDNKKARDIFMKNLEKYDVIKNAPEPVKSALKYAAYNWGIGNLNKFIQKQRDKGIDVYSTWDWINDLPTETRNYVNFIVRGIDGPNDLTEASLKKALPNRFK